VVQQWQNVDVVRCCKFFSELISMLVFGILHIPSGCVQSCHPTGYGPVHALPKRTHMHYSLQCAKTNHYVMHSLLCDQATALISLEICTKYKTEEKI
jgi:hypothetical protein